MNRVNNLQAVAHRVEPRTPTENSHHQAEPSRVVLPVQEWVRFANAYCGERFAEADGKNVMSVPAIQYGGYLHAIVSCQYGGVTSEHLANGYRLVPVSMFHGDTVEHLDWRDPATVEKRRRGDMTGLVVKVNGKRLVCAKAVNFVRDLPTVPPVSLKDAKEFDERSSTMGWRSMRNAGAEITWRALKGHPVAIYDHPLHMSRLSVLYWQGEHGVEEYVLHQSLDASMLTDPVELDAPTSATNENPTQMGLF